MKILADMVATRGCSSMVAATYGCDLAWFERTIGIGLRAAGVRQFVLFVDQGELAKTLESQRGLIGGAGRWYSVVPVRMMASFHPKLYLLTGDERARLWIGSGNLGPCGLGRNREVFERWEVEPGDPTVPSVFGSLREYLVTLVRSSVHPPAHVLDALEAALTAPALAGPPRADDERLLASPGELFTHVPTPPTAAETLSLSAPSFDCGGEFVVKLADRLRATSFDLVVDLRTTNLTPGAAARIQQRGGRILVATDERPSHAKLVWAEGPGWALGIHGSANLSISAWYGRNAELVVLRTGVAARRIGDLIEAMPARAYDAADEDTLRRREEQAHKDVPPPAHLDPGLLIHSCIVVDMNTIEVRCAGKPLPATALGLTTGDEAEVLLAVEVGDGGERLRARLPESFSRSVLLARLIAGELRGPFAVVHDPGELAEWAHEVDRGGRRLMELLLTDVDDPDLATAYVEACARVLGDRLERARRARAQLPDIAPAGARSPAEGPRWHLFRGPGAAPHEESTGARTGITNPVRLLARVLFSRNGHADDDDAAGVRESESPDEPAPRTYELRERPPVPAPLKLEFRRHLVVARDAYLSGLREWSAPLDADRLLEDLQILAIAAHRGLNADVITPSEYLETQVPILRAFLGTRGAPLPRSLAAWPGRASERARAELIGVVGAMLFQACLARAEITRDEVDPRGDFPDVGPVLWFRHVLDHLGPISSAGLDAAATRAARLRRLGLWLDRWPAQLVKVPFRSFLARMTADAHALAALQDRFAAELRQSRVPAGDAGDVTIVALVDGELACGFVEDRVGYCRHGAFQGASRSAIWEPLRQSQRGLTFDHLLELAAEAPLLVDALDALDRLCG